MRSRPNPPGTTIIAESLEIPWSMDFDNDGRLLFTEREGKVKVIDGEEVLTLLEIDVKAKKNDEGGLLGLVIPPKHIYKDMLYLYYTYESKANVKNRVSRFKLYKDELVDEEIIFNNIPGGRVHNGGRIKFGPDGKLYITTGETWKRELAQKKDSLGGKILRVSPDGSIPEDNPWKDSPVYSYGNRNSQGLAWHPITGEMFASEHGPSGENNWRAHDEINQIKPGENYGWPEVIGAPGNPDYQDPVLHTGDDTWAPSGATFLNKPDSIWHNRLFVANLRGNGIRMITFKEPDYIEVDSIKVIYEDLGRIRTVVQGPDNYLYFCTSNRDGRGNPDNVDDIIAKFKPP